ncbi:MAG: putative metal-binding motif-containing protein, partial [Flavobacterium sp.]
MKKLLLISFSICYIHIAAQVTYLTEQFEYPAGDFLIDNGWFAHSASGTNSVAVSTSGLNWSGYVASGIGNAALVTNTGEDVNKPFSSYPTEGSVYASFLMRVNAPFAASGSGFFFHLGYYNNTSTPVFTSLNTAFRARTFVLQGTNPSTQFKLGLSFNTNDATGSTDDLVIGQTYLVVVKYEFIDGANNDEVSLFVFPEGANIETEPTTPDLGPFTGSAADAPVLQAAVLRQYNAAQDVTVDGIVARDSWNIAVDCAGVLGGTAFIDNCDDCVGGTTGLEACVVDCNGVFNGSAFLDNCDVCVGGNTGLDPCVADCNGDFGGTAIIDNCDVCVGGNTGLNACVADCNGDFGGTAYLDTCNDCVAGNTGETPCPISFMEDQFNYTAGVPLTNHGWFAHSAAGTNPILVHSSGLAFTSYLGSNIGNAAAVTNTGQDINKPFSENATTGDVYASYLVRVDDPVIAASEGFFMHFGTYSNTDNPTFTNLSTAFRGRVHVTQGDNSDKFKLGLSFNAAAASGTTADLNVGQTYLVVVKYQFVPGETNDTVSLYVFEDGDDFSVEPLDPTIGPLTATPTNPSDPESTLAPDAPVIQAIALRQYNANQNIIVDGIFVKNTWDLLDNCDVLTWYADNDGDGFGVDTDSILACDSPGANYVLVGGDCDDTDATIYPGAPVICYDGIQQDCNLDETDGCPQITTQLLPN